MAPLLEFQIFSSFTEEKHLFNLKNTNALLTTYLALCWSPSIQQKTPNYFNIFVKKALK